MKSLEVHPHACKHGLDIDDITCAWDNAFMWLRRDLDEGGIDYVAIGSDRNGRLIELIARYCDNPGIYVIFHAMTPPTKKVLAEFKSNG